MRYKARSVRDSNGKCVALQEHRAVMQELGYDIAGKVVHHVDQDKLNNDPANLSILPSRRIHRKLHANTLGQPDQHDHVTVTCPECGRNRFVRYQTLGLPTFTGLCWKCNGKKAAIKLNCEAQA